MADIMFDRREETHRIVTDSSLGDEGAIALTRPVDSVPLCLEDRSMAGIACDIYRCRPTRIGRVSRISMEGLSFSYVDCENEAESEDVLDIVVAEQGFCLGDIGFEVIENRELERDDAIGPLRMKLLRVEFKTLLPDQIAKLKYLVENDRQQ